MKLARLHVAPLQRDRTTVHALLVQPLPTAFLDNGLMRRSNSLSGRSRCTPTRPSCATGPARSTVSAARATGDR